MTEHYDKFLIILQTIQTIRHKLRATSKKEVVVLERNQGFGSAFFFADPDPGKNLYADPDPVPVPDPGGIRGRGLGVKGKNDFFF